jgi:hypothetical protein
MSTSQDSKVTLQSILTTPQQVIRYIAGAVSRIFAPNDDQYPNTGVQPFEGEPTDRRKHGDDSR